jgi:hypothetical protein
MTPVTAMIQNEDRLHHNLKPELTRALSALEAGAVFSLPQALALAAVTMDLRPSMAIDLGTGSGGSSFTMALAGASKVATFDINDNWNYHVLKRVPNPPSAVSPIMTDITTFDFRPLLQSTERVLVFLDAHGFEVVARLLSHIMPLIADKPHVVFCHDISDNRLDSSDAARSYQGKRMWRGTDDYFANLDDTAYVNIGWMRTGVDQSIALADFCWRNRISFNSLDADVHLLASQEQRLRIYEQFGGPPFFGLTYFTMNESSVRNFPRC